MIVVGLVAATYAIRSYDRAIPTESVVLMGSRVADVQAAIDVMNDGGPPLTGQGKPFGAEERGTFRGFYPAGSGDDPGIYLYLPLVGQILGIDDPLELLKLFFLGLMGIAIAVLPVVMYHATGSAAVGLLSPILAFETFSFVENSDVYWIGAWCYLLTIPLLVAATRQRSQVICCFVLVVALVIASFASSIRSQVGLPIFISALAIGFVRSRRVDALQRVALGAILVAAYLVVSHGVIASAQAYRDHRLGVSDLTEGYPTGHPLWHTFYLGLGYLQNPYGIEYNDSVARKAAGTANPAAPAPAYLSEEYEQTLRHLYFDIVRDDPGFVFRVNVTKAGVAIADGYEKFPWLFFLAPLAAVVGTGARWFRRTLLIAAPVLAVSFAPMLVAVPIREYEIGWFGALGTMFIFTIGALVISARDGLAGVVDKTRRRTFALHSLSGSLAERLSISLGCGILIVILASPLTSWAKSARQDFFDRRAASTFQATRPITGAPVAAWDLARGLPLDWTLVPPADVFPSQAGLQVTTSTAQSAYQLIGPTLELRPGRYLVQVDGIVSSGGIAVGMLDTGRDEWISSPVGFSAVVSRETDIFAGFSLERTTAVRVVLTNSRLYEEASTWILRSVQLLTVIAGE